MSRSSVVAVRVVIALAFFVVILLEVVAVPTTAARAADMYPVFAYLQVPGVMGSIALLICVQVVLICIWRLVDLVAAGRIFDDRAFVWVDVIIAALWIATGLVIVGAIIVNVTGATAPGLFYPIVLGVVFGAGAALLVGIMRRLLRQATDLRGELDEVV